MLHYACDYYIVPVKPQRVNVRVLFGSGEGGGGIDGHHIIGHIPYTCTTFRYDTRAETSGQACRKAEEKYPGRLIFYELYMIRRRVFSGDIETETRDKNTTHQE